MTLYFNRFVIITILLTIIDSSQLPISVWSTINALWEMLPFFALAIGFAAYTRATKSDVLMVKVFSGNPVRAIIFAALVATISPFCSCGIIPLITTMLGAGVPLAPVMAFWIASPIMDPEMFILTAAGIGIHFAFAKTLAAISMGLFAGFAVLLIQRYGRLGLPLRAEAIGSYSNTCTDNGESRVMWSFWRETKRVSAFKCESIAIGVYLGKWLTLAFFLRA